ncbi:MAG TPA: hypothetical protein VFS53_02170 [Gemmatimonadota bacterium]|nr:hypothetical protein [Gemmatimonadota bacterium]
MTEGMAPSEGMPREDFQEQAVLYELGRLPADRRDAFEAELAIRGEDGRRVLESVRRAFARAGLGPGSTTVSAERAALAAVTARPIRRRRSSRGWPLVAVLAGILFVAALAWALVLRSERSGFERERHASEAAVDSLAREIAARDSLDSARPGATDLSPILASPDLAAIDLTGASGARGRLLAAADGALLVAEEMPPLSEEGSYHLWTRTPGGLAAHVTALGPAAGGYLLARFSDATFLRGADGVLVSAETGPAGDFPVGATMLQGFVPVSLR